MVRCQPFIHGPTIVLGEVDYSGVRVAHAHREREEPNTGGDREIQRRALRLYWPASRFAVVYSRFFFFFSTCLFFFLRKRWAKCLLIRPAVTGLFFTLASLQVSKWRVFRVGRLHHRPVMWKSQTTLLEVQHQRFQCPRLLTITYRIIPKIYFLDSMSKIRESIVASKYFKYQIT